MARVAEKNIGFKGTVTTDDWAELAKYMGVQFAVNDVTGLKASAGTGDRVVKVTAGAAWGHGVLSFFSDTNDVTLAGEPVTSGSSRWDLLVVRRKWTPGQNPTGTAELALVKGAASYPVRFDNSMSDGQADQPLWMVRFDAGKSAPQAFADLRTFVGQGGGMLALDEGPLEYLTEVGTHITLAGGANGEGKSWYRAVDAHGNAVWQQHLVPDHKHHLRDIQGISNPVTGNTAGLQVRAASWAGKNSSSGGMTLNFATPFPTACIAVVVTNGASDSISFWPEVVTKNRATFSYRIRDAAGNTLKNIQHRVDYIAIGV